jgi:hypothetical protein
MASNIQCNSSSGVRGTVRSEEKPVTGCNQSKAARLLRIGRAALRYKLTKHNR